jgi:UDP-glucose 4-epimerase
MLEHLSPAPRAPDRTVIVGGNSFVGKALAARLARDGAATLSLTRAHVDLSSDDAAPTLAGLFRPADTVVLVAAKAPCRNVDDFLVNAHIICALVGALQSQPVAHVVNISSDAVYGDEPVPISEAQPSAPGSLHGAMHLSREIALRGLGLPLAVLRPTLIYGVSDPHNGYGPNLFRRKANKGEDIVLFGEGEERRDHVAVEDVAELTARVVLHKSVGVLNVASGDVTSFGDVARNAVALSGKAVTIVSRPRVGPMPHNGYRPFDPSATFAAFPDFRYTSLDVGMRRAQQEEFGNG